MIIALSPDGGFGQFTRTSTPGLCHTRQRRGRVGCDHGAGLRGPPHRSPSPWTCAHPFIDDLTVELVAPDGTARTLHDRSGGNADGIEQTYAPDFGGTGIAGDWTLRVSDTATRGMLAALNGLDAHGRP